jgi:alpha-tubulin suppressor-like RCC1 family protein
MLAISATIVVTSPVRTQAAGSSGPPGLAWAWGSNTVGQLGNGTALNSSIPVQASLPSGTKVTAIASGGNHGLVLTSTGQVLAWGTNSLGQLGNGTTTNSCTPVAAGLPSGATVTAIAGGDAHSLALTSTGQVLAWGSNSTGQLGNGTTINSSSPVAVSLPPGTTVTAIAGGGGHSLALTSTGQVLAWGDNIYGQLGNGTLTSSSTPVTVILPPGTSVTAIACGRWHSLAVTSAGKVLAWGNNAMGSLGNGTTTGSSTPVAASLPSGTTATAVAGGYYHSLALTSTGTMFAWGYNGNGQLGNSTTTDSSTPVAVALQVGNTVTSIASGNFHNLAITSSSQVLAWGYNYDGQLGNGTTTTTGCTCISAPVVVSAFSAALAIAAGNAHSLAIQLPAVAVFPAMTNGAYGGYVTAATIKNNGSAPALVRIAYFNQNGAPVGAGDGISSLPANASWTVRQDNGNSFPGTGGNPVQAGSAIVYSSQPIASFVNEFAPGNVGDATSYTGVQVPSGVGTTLYAPTIVNNAYGGYTTGIGLLNQGSGPTDVTITYRDGGGIVVKTQTVTALAAHAYQALYSGDTTLALPNGFAGTATLTAVQPLGAIVNETGPGGQFSSYDAVPAGSALLNVPVALNNAYGGYYTGMGIQNTSSSPGAVAVTYYDASGTATAKSFNIAAFGSLGVYQGSATDGPAPGAYTAVIQSSTVMLAAIVNEVAPSSTSAKQSTSYNTFSTGASTLHLPLVENAGSDPWNTGLGIMNPASASTTVQVSYYDAITGAPIGAPQLQTLAPRAYWGLYQPTGGLPPGSRATAVVTTSSGGQVAVVCNESSPTTFMSYNGQ